ncbi:hypothetical protein ACLOJK_004537 [Asimina triloba]
MDVVEDDAAMSIHRCRNQQEVLSSPWTRDVIGVLLVGTDLPIGHCWPLGFTGSHGVDGGAPKQVIWPSVVIGAHAHAI